MKKSVLTVLLIASVIFSLGLFCKSPNREVKETEKHSTNLDGSGLDEEKANRQRFAEQLNRDETLTIDGVKAKITVEDARFETIKIYNPNINAQYYLAFDNRRDLKQGFREQGFKFVVFDNGKNQWTYPLSRP